jgi:hypothetical protein
MTVSNSRLAPPSFPTSLKRSARGRHRATRCAARRPLRSDMHGEHETKRYAPGPEPIFSAATPKSPPPGTAWRDRTRRGCSTWVAPRLRPAKPGPGRPRRIVSESASRLSGLVTTRFSAHVSDSSCLVERSGLRREESYTTGHETGQTRGKLVRRAQARVPTALPDAARPARFRVCRHSRRKSCVPQGAACRDSPHATDNAGTRSPRRTPACRCPRVRR